jgi:hypothetical protein
MDEDRNTSLLIWKRLHNPINEIQKIEQEFIKSYLEILETRRLYTST